MGDDEFDELVKEWEQKSGEKWNQVGALPDKNKLVKLPMW